MMRKFFNITAGTAILAVAIGLGSAAQAATFTLDFETPGTGSDLLTGPLASPLGSITLFQQNAGDAFIGQTAFGGFPNDLPVATFGNRLVEAGTTGNIGLDFGFDVNEITFNFGGDGGGFEAQVLDALMNVLDSITIGNFPGSGLAPGPTTLSGMGTAIRFFRFEDPIAGAGVDNVMLTTGDVSPIPIPAALPLMMGGLGLMGFLGRRKRGDSA